MAGDVSIKHPGIYTMGTLNGQTACFPMGPQNYKDGIETMADTSL